MWKIPVVGVGLLAVAIGGIGKFNPLLFLKINHGFILWAMTGNQMPPYIMNPWEEHGWLKDGDLVVSVGAKSGTTWMQQVVLLLLNGGESGGRRCGLGGEERDARPDLGA